MATAAGETHHEIREHLLQFQQRGLVFDVLGVLHTHTHTQDESLTRECGRAFALSSSGRR